MANFSFRYSESDDVCIAPFDAIRQVWAEGGYGVMRSVHINNKF